jgi:hypothetical protein
MANGNTVVLANGFSHVMLLDGCTAAGTGTWVDVGPDRKELNIHYIGLTAAGATVQLRGSNAKTKPADSEDGVQLGVDITADDINVQTTKPRWIKAKPTVVATASISVGMVGNG